MRVSYCRYCERRVKAERDHRKMSSLNVILCLVSCGMWLPFALLETWLAGSKYVCPRCLNTVE